jgi:phycocyanin alpha chain
VETSHWGMCSDRDFLTQRDARNFMLKSSTIAAADTPGRFLTKDDLRYMLSFIQQAEARLEASRLLMEKGETLQQELTQAINKEFPDMVSFFADGEIGLDKDFNFSIDFYVKIIPYCLLSGGTSPIDDNFLANLKEIEHYFSSHGVSFDKYIEAVKFIFSYIRSNHGLCGQAAEEINGYVNYIVGALPQKNSLSK